MRISDWSSDVCSSDLAHVFLDLDLDLAVGERRDQRLARPHAELAAHCQRQRPVRVAREDQQVAIFVFHVLLRCALTVAVGGDDDGVAGAVGFAPANARTKTFCLGTLVDTAASVSSAELRVGKEVSKPCDTGCSRIIKKKNN